MKALDIKNKEKNYDSDFQLADMLARTNLVPREFQNQPEKILIAIKMGAEVGLPPVQSTQNIAVINGRPCMWGDALLAVVKSHPDFVNIKEVVEGDVATCTVYRKGQSAHTAIFNVDDAKQARLWNKPGPWQQYPKRMLQMRARAFAIRDTFPDAIKGLHVREEVRDYQAIKDITPHQASDKAKMVAALLEKKSQKLVKPKSQSIDQLQSMITEHEISADIINKWLNKAAVISITEFNEEQINKCIQWIKEHQEVLNARQQDKHTLTEEAVR